MGLRRILGFASKTNAGRQEVLRHQKIELGSCENYTSQHAVWWATGRVGRTEVKLWEALLLQLQQLCICQTIGQGLVELGENRILPGCGCTCLLRLLSTLSFASLEKGTSAHSTAMGSHLHTQHAQSHSPACWCTFTCSETHTHTQAPACTLAGSHPSSLLDVP